jgi:NAD(P)-dependent dehydrogenase (short-subunit alcohol dehydrogenase family)
MTAPVVLRQEPVGVDLDRVTPVLTAAFLAIRDAVAGGRPVVIVLDGGDLLGQGAVADAAVATGLLGMMRTFAIEGAKPGWRVNAVAGREGDQEAVEAAIGLLAGSGLSGQLLQASAGHLGKVAP